MGTHPLLRWSDMDLEVNTIRWLKDLCALGGWKDPKTILTCYQVPDQEKMSEALKSRRAFGNGAPIRQSIRQS